MGWDERQIHTTSLTFSGEAAISMCVDRKTIFVLVYSLLLLFCIAVIVVAGIEYSALTLVTILKVRRQGKVRSVDVVGV